MEELCAELCGIERSQMSMLGSWISAKYFFSKKSKASIIFLKGQSHEIFSLRFFFNESSSPKPMGGLRQIKHLPQSLFTGQYF
jgi:hypothetical protein